MEKTAYFQFSNVLVSVWVGFFNGFEINGFYFLRQQCCNDAIVLRWVTIVSRVGQINTLITMTVVCMWPRSWRFVGLRASFRRLEMSFVKNRDHANIITTSIIFMVRDRTIICFVGCVITYWIGKLLGRLLLLKYYVTWRRTTTTWGLLKAIVVCKNIEFSVITKENT